MSKLKIENDETFDEIEEFLKVAADYTRLKILYTLLDGEMCVCDIQERIDASQSLVSHQLRVLKKADLVRGRKEGKHCFYSLSDEHVIRLLELVYEHVIQESKDNE